MTVGGFLVYLLYRFKNAKEINPFVSMVRGGMDTRHVFVTALVGFDCTRLWVDQAGARKEK